MTFFGNSIFRKLLLSAFLIVTVSLLLLDSYLTRYLGHREVDSAEQLLRAEAQLLAAEIPQGAQPAALEQWAHAAGERARARITLIDRRGVVLADSQHDPETMENHRNRPEIQQAYQGQIGSAIRHSATLHRDLCYMAFPLPGPKLPGLVLRLAVPLAVLASEIARVRGRILAASLVAAALALGISYYVSSRFTRRIRRLQSFAESFPNGQPSEILKDAGNDELGMLAASVARMSEQILKMIGDLERLERVRKDFVANVSHELRTPLAAIQGYAETLLDGALDDQQNNRRFLEVIRAHSIRLNNIASDLLVLSDLESGREAPEPERVSLRAAVESALRTVEAEARVRGVTLACGPLEDVEVRGYRIRLEQALVNLLDNAVKFNKPGGEVRVETSRAGGRVRIAISDTGIGIPAEDLSRIFERFYRVDRARSRQVGGTGLGLSIVKHVIERMHGAISVESELGVGSTFTIVLPQA